MFASTSASVGQNAGRAIVRRSGSSAPSLPWGEGVRSGISLTEVLIAMGILTVGLLGVAALFPVGGFYMQKGDIADRGSAIAQAAFNDALARGVLDPKNWLMWEDDQIKPQSLMPRPRNPSTFTRSFSDKLQQQLAAVNNSTLPPIAKQWNVATEFGAAFVIDPLVVAGVSLPITSSVSKNYATKFPATFFRLDPTANAIAGTYYSTDAWGPWYYSAAASPETLLAWPIRRVTLAQAPLTPIGLSIAERLFSSGDDLSMEIPTSGDKPSAQTWELDDLDNDGAVDDPLMRRSRGDYSWIIMVSPGSSDARNALATDPSAFDYEVSVAVFYKRVVGRTVPQSDPDVSENLGLLLPNERLVRAKVLSTGLSGGELLLEAVEPTSGPDAAPPESPFAGLRAGNWYLLAGPHPNSIRERPMFVARWYYAVSVDGKDRRLNDEGTTTPQPASSDPERRLVTLRGPQWPWQPQPNDGDLSNNLCLAVVSNVVAVHSKTVRLEGRSPWSAQ